MLRYVGFLLSAMAILLISLIGYASFFIILPVIASPWSLWYTWNLVFGIYLLSSVLYNYIAVVFTSPGIPNSDIHSDSSSTDNCKKCNLARPPRTHHCSICKVCVLKMDHHCPWINNCVGKRNYRFFVGFLFTVTLATTYLCCVLAVPMYKVVAKKIQPAAMPTYLGRADAPPVQEQTAPKQPSLITNWMYARLGFTVMAITPATSERSAVASGVEGEGASHESLLTKLRTLRARMRENGADFVDYVVIMLFVVSAAVASAVSILLGFHTYLVLTAQTTIEFYENISLKDRMRRSGRIYFNPYDKGLLYNLSQVFGGHRPWLASLLLPWLPSEREDVSATSSSLPLALLV